MVRAIEALILQLLFSVEQWTGLSFVPRTEQLILKG
jgi:hypothetical protein